jgi:hypothetical protein
MTNPKSITSALQSLDRLAEQNQDTARAERAAAQAKSSNPVPAPIRLLDHEPGVEAQARREGDALLGAMRRANVGQGSE